MSPQTWTAEDKKRGKEISQRRRRAQQQSSEEVFGSEQFWDWKTEEGIAEGQLNDLEWEVHKRGLELPAYERAREVYLQRREQIEKKRESLAQKANRFKKMRKFLSVSSTENLVSLRAAYLELVCTLQAKTSRRNQSFFVSSLREHYGHDKKGELVRVWNVITGSSTIRDFMTAAHIFPLSLGQKSMDYIFGEDAEDELNTARNGLFLPTLVEKAYDKHQITIVPDGPQTDPQDYKFLVLDKGGLWNQPTAQDEKTPFSVLHNRRLRFQPGNNFRPRARYLYFRYVLAMLIHFRSRQAKQGSHNQQLPETEMPELSRVWATEGKYLRKNLILAFIEGIGHGLSAEDTESILRHSSEDVAANEADKAKKSMEGLDLAGSDNEDEDTQIDDEEDGGP
ncbi:hypothetical protein V8E54_004773 [Elaphomyces granulatus]